MLCRVNVTLSAGNSKSDFSAIQEAPIVPTMKSAPRELIEPPFTITILYPSSTLTLSAEPKKTDQTVQRRNENINLSAIQEAPCVPFAHRTSSEPTVHQPSQEEEEEEEEEEECFCTLRL